MDWLSYHLYYHQNLNRATVGFVAPVVASLLECSWIDSFFFVRYGLGGPHLRLRLQVLPGCAGSVEEAVLRAGEEFLAREPSTSSQPEEAIRQSNQAILASDPHETDDSVYPDNTLLPFPFNPEIQRYGGPDLLPASLDFFAVSSLAALGFLFRHGEEPRQRQLGPALRLILRQALSFAMDDEELLSLATYGIETWGEVLPAIVAKGEKVFNGQRETFFAILRQELEALSRDDENAYFRQAARRLSATVATADAPARRRIGVSQLHMTATRMGLINPEEVYLSQLMVSTLREALAEEPTLASRLREASNRPGGDGISSPENLLRTLARLRENPPS
ncbi:MAG TPA: lantibiotic dehydratase C-terminal domain-containing protein [Thermoanaerobaculia bacterium]|jgi:hypothetical protein|nr:lantibiotic dehydratase C-terminal domain-containing protein [Thermoanaerobaculia bacterium]